MHDLERAYWTACFILGAAPILAAISFYLFP